MMCEVARHSLSLKCSLTDFTLLFWLSTFMLHFKAKRPYLLRSCTYKISCANTQEWKELKPIIAVDVSENTNHLSPFCRGHRHTCFWQHISQYILDQSQSSNSHVSICFLRWRSDPIESFPQWERNSHTEQPSGEKSIPFYTDTRDQGPNIILSLIVCHKSLFEWRHKYDINHKISEEVEFFITCNLRNLWQHIIICIHESPDWE